MVQQPGRNVEDIDCSRRPTLSGAAARLNHRSLPRHGPPNRYPAPYGPHPRTST